MSFEKTHLSKSLEGDGGRRTRREKETNTVCRMTETNKEVCTNEKRLITGKSTVVELSILRS